MSESSETSTSFPQEFPKVIDDFVRDITTTFPEYDVLIRRWWPEGSVDKEDRIQYVFKHCMKVFPERFFDLLYKNASIFEDEESDANTEFLPGIVFKHLWILEDVSDSTRETIWKYLQLISFTIMGSVKNASEFGETAKLFESIDETELKNKLQEALEGMQTMFQGTNDIPQPSFSMPDAEELHGVFGNFMGGKMGQLAMELAEETARDLNLDTANITSPQDVIQHLFKNPNKLMNMFQTVGGRLDEKMKAGDLNEGEMLKESMDILNRMKSMPGMSNLQDIFSKMGMPNLGKNARFDMNAMEEQLQRKMRTAQMKERMQKKREQKQEEEKQPKQQPPQPAQKVLTDEELVSLFDEKEKGNNNKKKKANKAKKVV